jgi:hypothetical protein
VTAESTPLVLGDRVLVYLDAARWETTGWLPGTVVRIEPYSAHRSFHWVELDVPARPMQGSSMRVVSVLNPRHIRRA